MMRELKRIIRENKGQWNDSEELRKEEINKIELENDLEREKKKRIKKAGKQKQQLLTVLLLKELPEKKREKLLEEEKRQRRLELHCKKLRRIFGKGGEEKVWKRMKMLKQVERIGQN